MTSLMVQAGIGLIFRCFHRMPASTLPMTPSTNRIPLFRVKSTFAEIVISVKRVIWQPHYIYRTRVYHSWKAAQLPIADCGGSDTMYREY